MVQENLKRETAFQQLEVTHRDECNIAKIRAICDTDILRSHKFLSLTERNSMRIFHFDFGHLSELFITKFTM